MLRRIPTRRGDVLILAASQTFSTYAVAMVDEDGQQDFGSGFNGRYLVSLQDAVKQAKTVVVPQGRIYLMNIDAGEWAIISCEITERSKSVGG